MIELKQITKQYPDGAGKFRQVLRGVDLSVAAGEFVAIKGESGAGKSTVLSILGLMLEPDSGIYLFDKQDVRPDDNTRNNLIGFMFQQPRLLPQLSIAENILLPTLAQSKQPTPEQRAYALHLMQLTGIEHIASQFPAQISGGEASRAALCRALVMKPRLLLADEPTGQLDDATAAQIIDLLRDINSQLCTAIVMVTHSAVVAAAAHRIVTLASGTLL